MKKRVAIALVVLGGVASIGVALIFAGLMNSPEASASAETVDLVAGRGETEVGQVHVLGNGTTQELTIEYCTPTADVLSEVHLCIVQDGTEDPGWLPPGNARKCEMAGEGGVHVGVEGIGVEDMVFDPDKGYCYPVIIPLNGDGDGLECGDHVYIQAHAALTDGQTAYGYSFKDNFDLDIPCCPLPPE